METIEFRAVVDRDQVIRPPNGVTLPAGQVEVRVRPIARESVVDSLTTTKSWLLALAADAEEAHPDLPADMAEQHDHYAHGKPRP